MIRKIILNWQTLFFRWHHWLKTQYEHLQACWPGGHFRPQRWHLQPEQQQEEGADRGRAEAELETWRALLLPQAGGREVAQPGQTVGGGVLRRDGSYCQCQVSQPVWSPAQETDKEFVEVSRHPLSVWTLRQVWWLRLDSVQYGLAGYLVRVWVCLMQINVGSDGTQITLSQSDKWLRQAKVIDGWSVTTTDTAIAFRWLLYTYRLSNAKLMNFIITPFI